MVLLLAAGWLTMRNCLLHFTPRAAFEDACLGSQGYILNTVGVYDASNQQYFLCREEGQMAVCSVKRAAGLFWTTADRTTYPVEGDYLCAKQIVLNRVPLACAVALRPEVDCIFLRLDDQNGRSQSLSTAPPYGDLYFWYLPDYFTGQDVWEALDGYCVTFLALDADGNILEEVSYGAY
jgi:hypothetical protein